MNDNLIIEEIERDFEYMMFEVARVRSPILKKIDKNFDAIRKNPKDRKEIVDLVKNIKEFTGIKVVVFVIKQNDPGAYIFTKYNNLLPSLFKGKEKLEVHKFKAEESPKYIKGIYILFGAKALDTFSSRELTAILLHEIGHVYQHTANFSLYFPSIVNRMSQGGIILSPVVLSSVVALPLIVSFFALSRSLTFFEHMGELNADEYAVKYGYGDELAKVFFKFNKMVGEKKRPQNWIQKTWESIKSFFSLSSHPMDSKRVCDIIDKMRVDYKKKYPKLSKEITTIYADIRC